MNVLLRKKSYRRRDIREDFWKESVKI